MSEKQPVQVAVTGAAGQICYSLIFQIASGSMLGPDQPVSFRLLEIPQAVKAAEGVVMELLDCAFPLVRDVVVTDDPAQGFDGANYAILVGAFPRGPGMLRKDLLHKNGPIFVGQGKALNRAADDLRVLVVGNPANTNCLIAASHARDIPANRFMAMTRLDHNRAKSQLAQRSGQPITSVKKMTIWGNHSATQFPDTRYAEIGGQSVSEVISDQEWLRGDFITTVQKRGAAIIEARGKSSAASAANAAVDHIRDWVHGTEDGDWVSMAIASDGSYGVPEGVYCSMPCTIENGEYQVVQNLEFDAFGQEKLAATVAELESEKAAIAEHLG